MSIPDPRQYPPVNARNPLIRQTMSLLTERDAGIVEQKRTQLRAQISDLLLTGDHASLNAALMQAPAQEAWQVLWNALREVLETSTADTSATLFAIPVIIVAGGGNGASLSGELSDTDALLQLLRQHGVVDCDATAVLSPTLISAESLASIHPAKQLQLKDSLLSALQEKTPLSFGLAPTSIHIKEESAWLRFLLGAAIQTKNAPPAIQMGSALNKWGMPFAQALGEQLKMEGATVLAFPRAPQNWLPAQQTGRTVLQETRLQLLASSTIRAIRSKGRTPVAVIAAHEGDEIRITFSAKEDGERWQGFVWPLNAGDHVEYISQFAQELCRDCQISDIRVIDHIQPDRDNDLPFFVTAHIPAKQTQ